MTEASRVANLACAEITAWLRTQPDTLDVIDVQGDAYYREIDVDLIWKRGAGDVQVELKGDRWDRTGNFFLETYSNREKGTPGCFLYTQANLLFYYFVNPKVLYILPMPATRSWFLDNQHRFRERSTTTPVRRGTYTTVGRLVPIPILTAEIPGVERVELHSP